MYSTFMPNLVDVKPLNKSDVNKSFMRSICAADLLILRSFDII